MGKKDGKNAERGKKSEKVSTGKGKDKRVSELNRTMKWKTEKR